MSSDSHEFIIPTRLLEKIKIEEDELFLHQSIVSKSINKNEEWYRTGDMVQVINDTPLTLVFVSRKSRIINVGGQNVNPQEIEEVLLQHPKILDAQVIPRPHPLIGNLITARIKTDDSGVEEAEIKIYLKEKLASYKIPRIITFVQDIKYGNTGKKLIR
jgi:acyl-CoA synthetase (AMP-forming)/AMP-acid ligase II